jgi:hypothetical protein
MVVACPTDVSIAGIDHLAYRTFFIRVLNAPN